MKNKIINFFKKIPLRTVLPIVGILVVLISSALLLWQGSISTQQSVSPTPAQVYFDGQYRIGDGDWLPIVKGEHISSTKGDVTLRGNFHFATPKGEYIGVYTGLTHIAFYTNHLNLTFVQSGTSYVIDNENPLYGKSACGEDWTAHSFSGGADEIEIIVHNPHSYGNENAIDQMLSSVAFWGDIEFEKEILAKGDAQRSVGFFFIITAFIFLGTALFSSLIHVKNSKVIWLLGAIILFAGIYCIYNSIGISFWSELVFFNTTLLGVSKMTYGLFVSALIVFLLKKTKKIGVIATVGLGAISTLLLVLAMTTGIFFYDTTPYWILAQSVASIVLLVCLIIEIIGAKVIGKLVLSGACLPPLAFMIDTVATLLGLWTGEIASQCAFVILFVVAMVVLLRIIPKNINAVVKAKELEREKLLLNAQLTESRVSTMMSQIRPHFIYNTLGSIEQLCSLDPNKAGELVHDFAKYLRGNFSEIDNTKPILMSQEMEHVHHYINIQRVRFPDMKFSFEKNSIDFSIPALTIQPLVENAIKHGLMKLEKGGEVKVSSYETETSYCVEVQDDGVGFDTSKLNDDRKHIGIRNIRERLKAMVSGTIEIESEVGVGTKVTVIIPKEMEL